MVCHKTKLVSILLKEEPNVPLLVIWTKQRKVLSPDDAVKRAVKQKVLLIFYCLHCAMPTEGLQYLRYCTVLYLRNLASAQATFATNEQFVSSANFRCSALSKSYSWQLTLL